MASSKVMKTNHDPPRVQTTPTHYGQEVNKTLSTINMDDILNNIYPDIGGGGEKTAEEVWKEIVAGREAEMTLEDFLTKTGTEEGGAGGRGRGKRRAVSAAEPPLDKATQQKQRRMIKNRESAARSRERKQAYTVELEALVTQLEEENARLVRQEAEESKKRFKQLMENLIPVEDKRKPPRRIQTLRRSNSMRW